jgi:hypothetical protein
MTPEREEELRGKVFAMELITAQVLALIAQRLKRDDREAWLANFGTALEDRFKLLSPHAQRSAADTYEAVTSAALATANRDSPE